VDPRAGLDTVSKRKILSPRQELKPDHQIVWGNQKCMDDFDWNISNEDISWDI
jgi:hypothetical protein